jgi:FKBP-type peptidyl-prolyl cis-trans isomerase
MTIRTYEAIGIGGSVLAMIVILMVLQSNPNDHTRLEKDEATTSEVETVVVEEGGEDTLTSALLESVGTSGTMEKLIIDDVTVGTGSEVQAGDTVAVHYVGTLQNGQEFDNSKKRGEPFTFTVGAGQVIQGWDQGLLGMKVGGTRILVIPSDLAYGDRGVGPIPGGATLVFSIDLIEIQ